MNLLNIILIIILFILIALHCFKCFCNNDSFENNTNTNSNIVLITEYFVHKDPVRFNEIKTSIDKNDKNKYIDKIFLLNEKENDKYLGSSKIINLPANKRSTFEDTFRLANQLPNGTIVIVSNNDISFDDTLKKLYNIDLDNTVICLGRRDVHDENKLENNVKNGMSQDSWIFKTPIKIPDDSDFFFGTARCDNHITYLLDSVGYKLINIPYDIKANHNHASEERKWVKKPAKFKNRFKFVSPTKNNKKIHKDNIFDKISKLFVNII